MMGELMLGYGVFAFVVLAIIAGLLVYMKRKYTVAIGDDSDFREAQDEGKIEIGFALASLVIVVVLTYFSTRTVWKVGVDSETALEQPDLLIVGHQWWWEIRYPKAGAVTANIAHVPKGKRLLVALESADVVHDWWVAGLGRKMDAIPGETNYFWLEADEVGEFEGACNEFCGMQHAWMRIKVVAMEPSDFEDWVQAQGREAEAPQSASAIQGSRLFQEMSCASCHSIRGTDAEATIGPDLTHVASRSTLLSGKLPYSKENLRRWLHDPQAEKPGAHMPKFLLDGQELDHLTEYLGGLK